MTGKLAGRVAIITGAARGMGAETARLFVAEGARVILTDILDGEGAALAHELGDDTLWLRHDVTSETSWQTVIDAAQERFGRLDILVNNAGVLRYATIVATSRSEFETVMTTNMTSVFLGTRAVVPGMIASGGGAIVNVSSTGAMMATNGTSAYAASKAAVRGFTKAAAMELGPRGIRVNSVHPGSVNTAMTNPENMSAPEFDALAQGNPLGRAGRPQEIARATLFLAGPDSSYCNGTEMVVDGGMLAGHYHPFLPGAPGAPYHGHVPGDDR